MATRLALLAGIALVAAGCSVDATGVHVTVHTGGLTIDTLDVTVTSSSNAEVGTGSYPGPVSEGATFGVRLPDSYDGINVDIKLTARNGASVVGTGSAMVTVVKQTVKSVDIDLMAMVNPDLGVDMTLPRDLTVDLTVPMLDGPPPDFASDMATETEDLTPEADLATDMTGVAMLDMAPDLSYVDLLPPPDFVVPPDLAMAGCAPSCANGIATTCVNNMPVKVTCGFGCNGPSCNGPNSCQTAGDISGPGDYNATTIGSKPTTTGSCQVVAGPDNTLKFSSAKWATWTLTVSPDTAASMFARLVCADPTTELTMNGLCNKNNFNISSACVQAPAAVNGARSATPMVLCGVPPNTPISAFVESPAGGGAYTINSASSPVDLNDCANAGMIPVSLPNAGTYTIKGLDTTTQQNKMTAPINGNTMGKCLDYGATAPEYVFWVPVLMQQNVKSISITAAATTPGFQPLIYQMNFCVPAAASCGSAAMANNLWTASWSLPIPPAGAYYFIVDGANGTSGKFDLTVTIK